MADINISVVDNPINVFVNEDPISVSIDAIKEETTTTISLSPTNYAGSEASPTSVTPTTGRTLTVSATPQIISLEGRILRPAIDYTVATLVVTFNVYVSDAMNITVFT